MPSVGLRYRKGLCTMGQRYFLCIHYRLSKRSHTTAIPRGLFYKSVSSDCEFSLFHTGPSLLNRSRHCTRHAINICGIILDLGEKAHLCHKHTVQYIHYNTHSTISSITLTLSSQSSAHLNYYSSSINTAVVSPWLLDPWCDMIWVGTAVSGFTNIYIYFPFFFR